MAVTWTIFKAGMFFLIAAALAVPGALFVFAPIAQLRETNYSVQQSMAWFLILGMVFCYGSCRSLGRGLRILRPAATASGTEPLAPLLPVSPGFRRRKAILSLVLVAASLGLLFGGALVGYGYPAAHTGAGSLFRAGVFFSFAIAAVFALQAASGRNLGGLVRAWRSEGMGRQLCLAVLALTALGAFAYLLNVALVTLGIGAPGK